MRYILLPLIIMEGQTHIITALVHITEIMAMGTRITGIVATDITQIMATLLGQGSLQIIYRIAH